ncbi:MAG: winged helix-turn-helix domain-containing protein [Methanotrichaceae archaeon]
MVQKRCREEIISQILEICCLGAHKTAIVYKANLNFRVINPYIELLSRKGLIEVNQGPSKTISYKTTSLGIDTLRNMRLIQAGLNR